MSSARDRLGLATTRLALLGEPQDGEPADVTEKRERYKRIRNEAMAEIAEADKERRPYKDSE